MWERPWKQTRSDGSLLYAAAMIIMVAHINHHQPVVCHALQVFDPTQTHPQHLNVLLIGFKWAELLLRYESSTPTSMELSSSLRLSVSQWGIRNTCPNLTFFSIHFNIWRHTSPRLTQYHQLPTGTASYWLCTTNYQPTKQSFITS